MVDYPRILNSGDSAISVEFGNKIDIDINLKVYALKSLLESDNSFKFLSLIPSYCSLLLEYDIVLYSHSDIKEYINKKISILNRYKPKKNQTQVIKIPVVYGKDFGPDIDYVSSYTKLTIGDLISIHTSKEYYVYMIGFSPGFPYLGGMDKRIFCPRLETPRIKIHEGSVGIAGQQTGIYPSESPGGWQIIGRTPLKLFNINQNPPALILPGSYVKFYPITEEEYFEKL